MLHTKTGFFTFINNVCGYYYLKCTCILKYRVHILYMQNTYCKHGLFKKWSSTEIGEKVTEYD